MCDYALRMRDVWKVAEPNCGFLFCSGKRSKTQNRCSYRCYYLFHKGFARWATCLRIEKQFKRGRLKHQLHPPNNFIELILAEFRIGLAEIRPGMNVINHQLEIVPVDVVIEATQDRIQTIVPFLPGI